MLAKTHMLVGATSFIAATQIVDTPTTPVQLALGMFVAAGAAILPDLDTPGATAARSLGPITQIFSLMIKGLAGGHRRGTHSILGFALFALLIFSVCRIAGDNTLVRVLLCCIPIGIMSRTITSHVKGWMSVVVMIGASYLVYQETNTSYTWIIVALLVGYASHIVADSMTKDRIMLFYPFSKKKLGLGVFTTGSNAEKAFGVLIGCVMIVAFFKAMHSLDTDTPLQIAKSSAHAIDAQPDNTP
jgi:membrane-bound metal-dependent hydrolase YbcI (DUF457 family)